MYGAAAVIHFRQPAPGCPPCGGAGGGVAACAPCALPRTTLYLTLVSGVLYGVYRPVVYPPLEIALAYDSGLGTWASGCVQVPFVSIDSDDNPAVTLQWYRWELECVGGVAAIFFQLFGLTEGATDEENCLAREPAGFPVATIYPTCALACADPLLVEFRLYVPDAVHAAAGGAILADAPGAGSGPIAVAGTVSGTVRRCASGPAIGGATVALYQGTGTTPSDTTTADGAGAYSFTVTASGRYRVRATDPDGCTGTDFDASVSLCEAGRDPTADPLVCCGAVRVTVRDALTGDPLPSGQVRRQGTSSWLDADGSGEVLLGLTSAEMLALAASGSDCTTRLLPIEVRSTAVGYLERCPVVTVDCGSTTGTPSEAEVLLWPVAPDFVVWEDCPDDCTLEFYAGRKVVPACLAATNAVQYLDGSTWKAPLGESPSTWPPAGLSARIFTLDGGLLTGATTATGYPFPSSGPRLVYYWESAPGFTYWHSGLCDDPYTRARIWLAADGASLLRLDRPESPRGTGCDDIAYPGGAPDCATCPSSGTRFSRYLDFVLDGSFNACARVLGPSEDLISLGATGTDYRWEVRALPASCP